VLAVVLSNGAANSHTAIFAVTMGIPAVIGLGEQLSAEWEGKHAAVDGGTGSVYIEPDTETAKKLSEKQAREDEQKRLFQQLKQRETKTKDGVRIELCANIGNTKDVVTALQNGAEGIGLFRSEFLFLERTTYPTEEEQFSAYKEAVEKMAGKRVVIRTIDIGADKQAAYFDLPTEENPAMGMRAIRICLTRPELFKVQLRALYRASAFGKLAIMFPMITSVSEVKKIKELCGEVTAELERQSIPFSKGTELGVMIETPASALISDELAQEVDFFSVGTNDLTQYTLAVDRGNAQAAKFCDTHHKAVLRLIELAATNAHKEGIWIGICGELAADEALTETFLSYGINELSVSPFKILGLRAKISELTVENRTTAM
jgi:phosphotransferase system enzyme I (PtsI)